MQQAPRVATLALGLGLLVAGGLALATRPTAAQTQPAPGPAPTEDRVGFPENYQTAFVPYYVLDRSDNKQVRAVYANETAALAQAGEPYPYGSILVMETYRAKTDAAGTVLLDEQGRFQRDALTGIFAMRKEPGFGEAYQAQRTGEWEYVAYRPDRTHLTPPERTNACARCHLDAGADWDWVFRSNLFFGKASGAVPRGVIQNYVFLPETLTVKTGTTVTWYNDDRTAHTVTAADGRFDSGRMLHQASFSYTFAEAGVVEYRCTLHQNMNARIGVEN